MGQRAQETRRRGVEVASIEEDALHTQLAGDVAVLAQQARLPQPTRPKNVQDEERQLRLAQNRTQAVAFTHAADELPAARLFQPLVKGQISHHPLLGPPQPLDQTEELSSSTVKCQWSIEQQVDTVWSGLAAGFARMMFMIQNRRRT